MSRATRPTTRATGTALPEGVTAASGDGDASTAWWVYVLATVGSLVVLGGCCGFFVYSQRRRMAQLRERLAQKKAMKESKSKMSALHVDAKVNDSPSRRALGSSSGEAVAAGAGGSGSGTRRDRSPGSSSRDFRICLSPDAHAGGSGVAPPPPARNPSWRSRRTSSRDPRPSRRRSASFSARRRASSTRRAETRISTVATSQPKSSRRASSRQRPRTLSVL